MSHPQLALVAACCGLATANVGRPGIATACAVGAAACVVAVVLERAEVAVVVVAVAAGWWWGGARLDAIDHSALRPLVGTAERAVVEVTAPPHPTRYGIRVTARVLEFGRAHPREPVLLELPLGRAPPLGARLEVDGVLGEPRGPERGFDERTWLRHRGIHVVLDAHAWHVVGRRHGIVGVADALHRRLAAAIGDDLRGEQRAVVEGVVLGEDGGLSQSLRQSFRVSGLYHLLAVSGQNVALVAGGALAFVWLLGFPRVIGELVALLAMTGYVLAVGPQPSVVRAGIAGALGSLAWLTARQRDRWHALLVAAIVLLGWSPYNALDAGFQLSFVAVASIFTLAPRLRRALDGYPVPPAVADVAAISTACSLATAPVIWLDFHAVPALSVPANLVAAPAVVPLLGLAFATAVLAPVAPAAATLTAHLDGLVAAYLAGCARAVARIPGAQIRSGRAALAAVGLVLLAAAYAWRHAERAEAGLSPHG